MEKRIISLFILVSMVLTPVLSSADDAYMMIKHYMNTQWVDSVDIPSCMEFSSRHLEANTTGSIINMIDQWIAIEGDTNSGIHECLAYTDLSEMQMLIYATALLMSYETTDSARSMSKSYHIVLKYGEDDDDLYVIDSQDKADAIVEIIQSAMGSDE